MKVIIVGAGPGGYVAAIRAAQLGAEVTLIERQYVGGTCLNVGCIPTKCLLHSAELFSDMKTQGAAIGVEADQLHVNFQQVIAHKDAVSQQLTMGVTGLLRMNKVKKIDGTAVFTGPDTLEVTRADGTSETMTADAIVIAVGSVNAQPPIPGIDHPLCMDSTGALSLKELPQRMTVVGAGVIGVELACAYAAFGTKVTIIEALDQMLPMLDGEQTAAGCKHMKKMGIHFMMGTKVTALEDDPDSHGVRVLTEAADGRTDTVQADRVLVAVGRKANTASLQLDAAGIAQEHGYILVDDRMRTNVPGVYAIGDCVYGKAQLAHTASVMGEVAVENIMGMDSVYDESTNPTCVYMEPEAASVGLTEEQCISRGIPYRTGRFPMMGNGRALILNGGEGLVKILADPASNRILGMHIIGPHASDLIAEGAMAIRMQATVDDLIQTIHSHPTVSEAVREAALNVEKRCIHFGN